MPNQKTNRAAKNKYLTNHMMKTFVLYLLISLPLIGLAQGVTIKAGDDFPAIPIKDVLINNRLTKQFNLNEVKDRKFYILNFWGTWCSPCIPEMDTLAILQKSNADRIQVIAISDESVSRLQIYLKAKPTPVWIASDTTALFYRLFNLSYVGQSAIIDANHKVVAVVKTHSINQKMLNTLYRGGAITSDADVKQKPVNTADDIFGVDSTLTTNYTIKSFMIGQQAMGKRYLSNGPYKQRRLSYVNTGIAVLYKSAYDIVSENQVIWEADKKKWDNYDDKSVSYCVDLLVAPNQKDSLFTTLQQRLNATLPVKARIEYRKMPVYVLINKSFSLSLSASTESSYGFSGKGYEGEAVTIASFAAEYLTNELDLPVVDETNLTGKYDVKTNMEMRTRENVMKSVDALGLRLDKQERTMKVLILY